jgi:hypothetical protein
MSTDIKLASAFKQLSGDYPNESWSARYYADVAADFASTRLSYACAAHLADDFDETSIPMTTHDVLPGISDGVWRETVKDFLAARSFRRDIFVRGPSTHAGRADRGVRPHPRAGPGRSRPPASGPQWVRCKGEPELYSPILDRLAAGPVRVSQQVAQLGGPQRRSCWLRAAPTTRGPRAQRRPVFVRAQINQAPRFSGIMAIGALSAPCRQRTIARSGWE